MKTYTPNSLAWRRKKFTQKKQREAAIRRELYATPSKPGQKYLYPWRRDENGRIKPEYAF